MQGATFRTHDELSVRDASAYAPPGQLGKLVAVSILDDVEDIIVQPARRESVADGKQCIHTISGLIDLNAETNISCYLLARLNQRTWSY